MVDQDKLKQRMREILGDKFSQTGFTTGSSRDGMEALRNVAIQAMLAARNETLEEASKIADAVAGKIWEAADQDGLEARTREYLHGQSMAIGSFANNLRRLKTGDKT